MNSSELNTGFSGAYLDPDTSSVDKWEMTPVASNVIGAWEIVMGSCLLFTTAIYGILLVGGAVLTKQTPRDRRIFMNTVSGLKKISIDSVKLIARGTILQIPLLGNRLIFEIEKERINRSRIQKKLKKTTKEIEIALKKFTDQEKKKMFISLTTQAEMQTDVKSLRGICIIKLLNEPETVITDSNVDKLPFSLKKEITEISVYKNLETSSKVCDFFGKHNPSIVELSF